MRRILLVCTFALVAISLSAHNQKQDRNNNAMRFNPQEFVARMETYITQKAGFTPEEAAKFYPIFHEMKGKQHKLSSQAMKLKRDRPATNSANKEYSETVSKLTHIDVEIAKIADAYYKKMCKVVAAQKVYKAMLAEESFNREMLQRFQRGQRNPWQGQWNQWGRWQGQGQPKK